MDIAHDTVGSQALDDDGNSDHAVNISIRSVRRHELLAMELQMVTIAIMVMTRTTLDKINLTQRDCLCSRPARPFNVVRLTL